MVPRTGLTRRQLERETERAQRATRRFIHTLTLPTHATAQDLAAIVAGMQKELDESRRVLESFAAPDKGRAA